MLSLFGHNTLSKDVSIDGVSWDSPDKSLFVMTLFTHEFMNSFETSSGLFPSHVGNGLSADNRKFGHCKQSLDRLS